MTETADVVIIGSGIVGSSVAYHLAQAGCTNVLVIEREAHQGKGSTGKSMGGVRAQFSTPVNIQMSKYSIDFFSKFDEVVGHPADYRAHGYLFCATSENHLAYLRFSCIYLWREESAVKPAHSKRRRNRRRSYHSRFRFNPDCRQRRRRVGGRSREDGRSRIARRTITAAAGSNRAFRSITAAL